MADRGPRAGRGGHPSRGRPQARFGEYATERVEARRPHKASTRAQVDSHLRNHLLPTFGAVPVGAIRPAHVEAWVAKTGQVLAPATLYVVFAWLNCLVADAVSERLIRDNPPSSHGTPAYLRLRRSAAQCERAGL